MDPQQPEAKPQPSNAHIGVPQARGRAKVVRAYPKPPALLPRFLLLLLKPESWPAAAQYPFWVTLVPLILAVTIASAAVALSARAHVLAFLQSFAQSYDKQYPALVINSDGVVKTASPAATQPFDLRLNDAPFVVDTTGKTPFESVKGDFATLVTDHNVYERIFGTDLPTQSVTDVFPFSLFVPAKGEPDTLIDSAHLSKWISAHAPLISFGVVTFAFILKFLVESLWVLITLFLLRPAIMVGAVIGEKRLIMPKRALYRIGAALLVPVVVFAGLMQAAGYSAAAVVGGENALILWYFACAALAVWAGHLAQQMYAPKPHRPRHS